jgi:hypothetical protein
LKTSKLPVSKFKKASKKQKKKGSKVEIRQTKWEPLTQVDNYDMILSQIAAQNELNQQQLYNNRRKMQKKVFHDQSAIRGSNKFNF